MHRLSMYGLFIFLLVFSVSEVFAVERSLGEFRDWRAWEAVNSEGKKECHAFSQPIDLDKKLVGRKKDQVYLVISRVVSERKLNEVSIISGYKFLPSHQPLLIIDGEEYLFISKDDRAWAIDEQEDARIIRAMRSGLRAVFKGINDKRQVISDGFSLLGFSDAWKIVSLTCSLKE